MKATIKFDDGKEVELSEETTKKLRAELVKPKHVWKHGDVGRPTNHSKVRIFLVKNDKNLGIYYDCGGFNGNAQRVATTCNYQYLGNIFDGTYKP